MGRDDTDSAGAPVTATTSASTLPRKGQTARPRTWPIGTADILLVLIANAVLVVGIWVRHGGLDQLGTTAGLATGLGQVTALLGTYLALVGILLMARVPWIDHVVGSDRLIAWHRWTGFATLWLLLAHAAFTTAGWALAAAGRHR